MLSPIDRSIQLARIADARDIALMSRELIEHGLHWSWTPARVAQCIRHPETNVAVARGNSGIAGFGIMEYGDSEAHLLLFAVRAIHQRRGLGSALMTWLETVAVTAGIERVQVEARVENMRARAFYRAVGFEEVGTVNGMYGSTAHGVRLAKRL